MKNYVLIALLATSSIFMQAFDEMQDLPKPVERHDIHSALQTADQIMLQGVEKTAFKDLKELKSLVDDLPDQTKTKMYELINTRIDIVKKQQQDVRDENHSSVVLRRLKRRRNLSVAASIPLGASTYLIIKNIEPQNYKAIHYSFFGATALSVVYFLSIQDKVYDAENVLALHAPKAQESETKSKRWFPRIFSRKAD